MEMLFLKAIVYRVFRILIVLIVALLVVGNIQAALSISAIDAIIATIYYYFFDKAWFKFEEKIEHFKLHWKYRKLDQ